MLASSEAVAERENGGDGAGDGPTGGGREEHCGGGAVVPAGQLRERGVVRVRGHRHPYLHVPPHGHLRALPPPQPTRRQCRCLLLPILLPLLPPEASPVSGPRGATPELRREARLPLPRGIRMPTASIFLPYFRPNYSLAPALLRLYHYFVAFSFLTAELLSAVRESTTAMHILFVVASDNISRKWQ